MKTSPYQHFIVTTFRNPGEHSSAKLRVKPLPDQGLPEETRVECSRKMRSTHPAGTIFKIRAKVTDREGGKLFLFSPHTWGYAVVSTDEAISFIRDN